MKIRSRNLLRSLKRNPRNILEKSMNCMSTIGDIRASRLNLSRGYRAIRMSVREHLRAKEKRRKKPIDSH